MTNDPSAHFARLRAGLDLEAQADAEARRRGAPEHRRRALRLVDEDDSSGGVTKLRFEVGRGAPLPDLGLSANAPVELWLAGDEADSPLCLGIVAELDSRQVTLAVQDLEVELDRGGRYALLRGSDDAGLRRQREALDAAAAARGDRLAELRERLLGRRPPGFEERELGPLFNPQLDESQRAAVALAHRAADVAVIHGPPGTGKTTTVIEVIRQAIARGESVLACAPSHIAVDNLVERLDAVGEEVVRLGHPARALEPLRARCLDLLTRDHDCAKLARDFHREARQLRHKATRWTRAKPAPGEKREMLDESRRLRQDAWRLEREARERILSEASVVASTLTGLSRRVLGGRRFDLVVIDECCQTPEPACWIAIARAGRVVLAGDPCQLPPTVISAQAAREGYAVSLQERVTPLIPAATQMLELQYRMHEDIMSYSSLRFYDGRLRAHPSVAAHLLAELPDVATLPETERPLRFIDTAGAELREAAGDEGSLKNPGEARCVGVVLGALREAGVPARDIALISPYRAQVELLTSLYAEPELEIDTVDGFQGREKEAIIISLVRSNHEGIIGFLKDTRRFNVALTRARRHCTLIGDSATLGADAFYAELLEYVDACGAYGTIWDDPALCP